MQVLGMWDREQEWHSTDAGRSQKQQPSASQMSEAMLVLACAAGGKRDARATARAGQEEGCLANSRSWPENPAKFQYEAGPLRPFYAT